MTQTNEKKLKVRESNYQHELPLNEWMIRLWVSSGYVKPTKFFQNNPPIPEKKTLLDRILSFL
jgi:hypothetical protein